jgi:thiol-disulfide isomerase/thioredoxin
LTTKANRSRGMPRRAAPVARKSSRTPLIVGAIVIGVAIVAAIVAIVLSSGASGGVSEPATTPVGVTGTSLPPLTDPSTDPAVGQTIPTLAGTDLAGEPLTIGPDDGPMAIVILAHWCSHCQAEVPLLVDYLESTGMPDGVRIVAISTSINRAQPNYPPSSWLDREGWTEPTLVDDASNSALSSLGMSSFPGFVFVDAQGRVVGRLTGEVPIQTFESIVGDLAP